jgi:probable rRNA maturation factor
MIDVTILDERWENKVNELEKITKKIILACFNIKNYEISVVFTDDKFIRQLNNQYRNIDKATNVLSFNYTNQKALHNLLIGEIVLSFDTILKESQEQEIEFFSHAKHMLVHGALHILGYKHDTDEESEVMEEKEKQILELV